MAGKRKRRQYDDDSNSFGRGVARVIARAAWRWRWHLTPLYVALGAVPVALIVDVAAWWLGGWWPWLVAVYAVAALATVAWISTMDSLRDKLYAAFVVIATAVWVATVAITPVRQCAPLYGFWALAWPVAGLPWWTGRGFGVRLQLDRWRHRWRSIAELAGIDADLISATAGANGAQLRISMSGRQPATDVQPARLENALGARVGSVRLVRDKTNARMLDVHVLDRDPWAGGELRHPVLTALPELAAAALAVNPTTEEVAA